MKFVDSIDNFHAQRKVGVRSTTPVFLLLLLLLLPLPTPAETATACYRAPHAGLHAGLPPGSEIQLLDAGHLHPRRPDLMRRVVELSRDWLLVMGAAQP